MKKSCVALLLVCLAALPLLAQTNTSWEIIRADYGSGNNWVDVTDRVRSLVQGDSLNFTVDGNTLGASQRFTTPTRVATCTSIARFTEAVAGPWMLLRA